MSEAIKIFYSYSRADLELRNRLDKQLNPLRVAGKVETWHDLQLAAGSEWEKDLKAKLEGADIILLLISEDFLGSKYCFCDELKIAIAQHQAGQAQVIPVIMRACDWNYADVPFSVLNVVPIHAKPVMDGTLAEIDRAFTDVARKIREAVEQIIADKKAQAAARAEELRREAEEKLAQEEAVRQRQLAEKLERRQWKQFSFRTVRVDAQGKVITQPEQRAWYRDFELAPGIPLEMVYLEGGSFLMGSNESNSEKPIHRVSVPSFCIGKYLVTQEQYLAVMGQNPSHFKGNNQYPVESVSWQKAMEFCEKLSVQWKLSFFLPSEAQWEYACRAGTTTDFAYGETINAELANFGWQVGKVSAVGQYPPNTWGLHDMHGNLWEWCQDDWHRNYEDAPIDGSAWISKKNSKSKLMRGGAWHYDPNYCRSAVRFNLNDTGNDVGFRVVCEPPRILLSP